MPGVHWGAPNGRGLSRPYANGLSGGMYPPLVLFRFGDNGAGSICLMCPSMLSLLACMYYAADRASPATDIIMKKMWTVGRKSDQNARTFVPPAVHGYTFTTPPKAAHVQTPCFDRYTVTKLRKPASTTAVCGSVLHARKDNYCPMNPMAPFVFQINMCKSCFQLNMAPSSPGILEKCAGTLGPHRPRTAKEIIKVVTPVCMARTKRILTAVRRTHLVAGLDTHAMLDYSDANSVAEHGVAIMLWWYFFPDVYCVRAHSLALRSEMPMTAYGRHVLMHGGYLQAHAGTAVRLGVAVKQHASELANAGRMELAFEVGDIDQEYFAPWISYAAAIEFSGVRCHHVLLSIRTAWFTREFARTVHMLATGKLMLRLCLLPPLAVEQLRPPVCKRDGDRRVTRIPTVARSSTLESAYRDYTSPFFHAEHVTWEWISMMVDMHIMAAERCGIPPPPFQMTLAGSYYKATCRNMVVDRNSGTQDTDDNIESIALGGVFQELVETAAAQRSVFGPSVVIVDNPYTDMLNYSDLAPIELNFVSGIVCTEQQRLVTTQPATSDTAFKALAQFCSEEGHAYAETRILHNPVMDSALVTALKQLPFHDTLADRLGCDAYTVKLADNAVAHKKMPKFRNMSV